MPRRATQRAVTASLIVTALLVSAGLTACGKTETAASLMSDAQQYESKGDNKAALIQLKNAAGKSPADGEVRLRLADIYLKLGDPVSAEKEARKAMELKIAAPRAIPMLTRALVQQAKGQAALDASASMADSKDSALVASRGDAYMTMRDFDKAGAVYASALAITPGHAQSLLGMARLAAAKRDFEGAGKLVDQALATAPKDTDALFFKGELLRAQNKPEEAAQAFGQAIAAKPDVVGPRLERANIYMSTQKYDLAKADIDAARKSSPNSVQVMYTQAVLEFSQNNFTAANDSIEKVLSKVPDYMPAILLAGAIEVKLGSTKLAEQHLSTYLANNPDNLYARKLLAQTQLRTQQIDSAEATLAPALQKNAGDAQMMALAGETSLRSKNFVKATQYFEQATAIDPNAPLLRTSLGLSMLAQGNQDGGLAELEKATAMDPKSEAAGIALVRSELAAQHYDKALTAVKAIIAAHPQNPDLFNLEGAAYGMKGDGAAARASFEKAVSLKPDRLDTVMNLARLDLYEKKPEAAKARLLAFSEKNKTSAPLLALAGLAASQKNGSESTMWLEKASADYPDDVTASLQLINRYIAIKQPAKALNLARKLQTANPSNPDALDALGQAQVASNDNDGALDTYSKLVAMMPKSAAAQMRMAAVHARLKNVAATGEDLKKALAIEPNNERARVGQIEMALATNKPDEALSLARAMQKAMPKSPIGFLSEGDILSMQKKYDPALRAYNQAFAVAATSNNLMKIVAALNASGQGKEARSRLSAWIASHPNEPLLRMYNGEMLLADKNYKGASDQFEAVLKVAPNDPAVLNNLAFAYQQQKDARALPTAELAIKAAPDNPAVLDTLGWILAEQGQTAKALPMLKKASDAQPQSGDLRYHYAAALAKSGDKKAARQELEKALQSGVALSQQEEAKALLKTL